MCGARRQNGLISSETKLSRTRSRLRKRKISTESGSTSVSAVRSLRQPLRTAADPLSGAVLHERSTSLCLISATRQLGESAPRVHDHLARNPSATARVEEETGPSKSTAARACSRPEKIGALRWITEKSGAHQPPEQSAWIHSAKGRNPSANPIRLLRREGRPGRPKRTPQISLQDEPDSGL